MLKNIRLFKKFKAKLYSNLHINNKVEKNIHLQKLKNIFIRIYINSLNYNQTILKLFKA
jgi:hypothetical protein